MRQKFPTVSVTQELPAPSTERQTLTRMSLACALECLTEAQREAFLLVKAEGITIRPEQAPGYLPEGFGLRANAQRDGAS